MMIFWLASRGPQMWRGVESCWYSSPYPSRSHLLNACGLLGRSSGNTDFISGMRFLMQYFLTLERSRRNPNLRASSSAYSPKLGPSSRDASMSVRRWAMHSGGHFSAWSPPDTPRNDADLRLFSHCVLRRYTWDLPSCRRFIASPRSISLSLNRVIIWDTACDPSLVCNCLFFMRP